MVKVIYELYKDDFKWKEPPYEYVFDRNPFDVIAGTPKIRQQIELGNSLEEIELSWSADVESFSKLSKTYHLY
jgi:uncharacterized protein YbbC (DUF1343 family)